MSVKIKASHCEDIGFHTVTLTIDRIQDYCPLCHRGITPEHRYGWATMDELQVIFHCPYDRCNNLFIAYYRPASTIEKNNTGIQFFFKGSAPGGIIKKDFPNEILKISEKFSEIYNQAKEAEDRGLKEICGAGYRRALEFLIKDYLIKEKVEESTKIRETWLGTCIENYIDSRKLKDCAKRAAWLGNDETHYIRKWKTKDLEDLKDMIQLTANWIHDEHLTKRIIKEMPEKK